MPNLDQQPSPVPTEKILTFLKVLKPIVAQGDICIAPRNYVAMAEMGINIEGVCIVLMSLTEKDYFEGPMEDKNKNLEGDVWVFGTDVEGTQVYIKIRLDRSTAVCVSFHPAREAMRFPHK